MSTTMSASPTSAHPHREPESGSSVRVAVGIAVGLTVLVMLILTAFAYPATHAEPHNVPVAIVGPESAVQQISDGLAEQAGEDGFDVETLSDRGAAEAAVEDREVYGAIVLGQQGGEMLIASAASPAVAQILTGVAAGLPVEAGGPLQVTDVVALPEAEPRGVAIGSALLPLIVAGIGSATLIFLRIKGVGAQLTAAGAMAITVALGVTVILNTWLDALPGSFFALWGTFALAIASMNLLILGLCRLIGVAGVGVGALLIMFLGNPFSGATSAPELLPAGWGFMGQLLPPGASASLMRSTGYFDSAGAGMPLWVLAFWVVLGVVLAVVGSRRSPLQDH